MIDVENYLIPGESVQATYPRLRVSKERGYLGVLTNRRVIFLKKTITGSVKIHDMEYTHIASTSMESKRRTILLIIGMLMILVGQTLLKNMSLMLFLLGALLIVMWYFIPEEYAYIRGGGYEISVYASRRVLEDFIMKLKNQMMKTEY
ncbi:MAG: PH domain-containing protein [Candidatus Asgardarchaeia archaeon]